MALTLGDAISRVRYRIDDEDEVLASDAQITDALRLAQEEVWHLIVESGSNLSAREEKVTLSNGTGNLAGLLSTVPLRVIGVSESSGQNGRLNMYAARLSDGLTDYTSNVDVLVNYIPKIAFPATSGADFVWGSADVPDYAANELMVLKAAKTVKITENDISNAIEMRAAELDRIVRSQINIPSAYAMPLMGRGWRTKSRLRYVLTSPYTMQVVW
jgi:hypothetical protein